MMKYTLVFRLKSTSDLQEIEIYYNKISTKIADQFFDKLSQTLTFIQEEPSLFQQRYKQVRIATLAKFPYGIHYKIVKYKIVILRVLHFKRLYNVKR